MIDATLYHRLLPISRRIQMRRALVSVSLIWLVASLIALGLIYLRGTSEHITFGVIAGFGIATLIATIVGLRSALGDTGRFTETAESIERVFPELDFALVTAVEQQPASSSAPLGYLQSQVVRRAVYHGYENPWVRVIPQWQLLLLGLAGLASFCLLAVTTIALFRTPFGGETGEASRMAASGGADSDSVSEWTVEPGDCEIEKGTSLLVTARFPADEIPGRAELTWQTADGDQFIEEMPRSLEDPLFGVRLASVEQDLEYRVRYDDSASRAYQVKVFEFPRLEQADATLSPPSFVGGDPEIIRDVRRVSAVRRTTLAMDFRLNKPVETARLLGSDGQQLELSPSPEDPHVWQCEFEMLDSTRLELRLTDMEGRENKDVPVFSISVTDNGTPRIQRKLPRGDIEASPLEEVPVSATVSDDTGIQAAGITLIQGGEEPTEIVLSEGVEPGQSIDLDHLFALEDLNAEVDDLFTFYFWAEDLDTDGAVRRTQSDLVFVEVRPFEEIWREGDAQPQGGGGMPGGGGGGGGGGEAAELVELQKQIINALWNLHRRRPDDSADRFREDLDVVQQSHEAVLQLLQQAVEATQDETMQTAGDEARKAIESAMVKINPLLTSGGPEDLLDPLADDQQAYRWLLKMREREFQVSRANQQQGSGSQNSRQQRQMQQLQLKNDENRYQTEQQAQAETETAAEREDRQILSRLRELARRQEALNERIRELQASLEEAETEEERQEIEDQLKRLQEEQEQILRDAEELQERMEQADDPSRMNEESQQLSEARENIQEANESLQQGDVANAGAQGTRAERQLQELREEFQNRASGQFDDQIQQLRNRARDIEEEQERINERLSNEPNEPAEAPSLSDDADDDDLVDQLQKQSDRVSELEQDLRDLVVESEEIEPIMADKLYDTWREVQQAPPEEALQWSAESLRRGLEQDARELSEQATRGIRQLREGIDQAAESVLGDEADALRRANAELQRLTSELENDARRAGGDPDANDEPRDDRPNGQDNAGGESEPGKSQPGENEPRESEPAENETESSGSEPNEEGSPGDGQSDEESNEDGSGGTETGQPNDGQTSSQQTGEPQQGSGGNGQRSENPFDSLPDTGPPSLDDPQQGDPNGILGAEPQLNYNNEDWLRPFSGDDYLDWSDRLRDVEEMVADPELRQEATRIREQARDIRGEARRHSREPDWEMVELKVLKPLYELQNRVHEELLRQSGEKSLVPLDRDPVPPQFEDAVRQYYEALGRGSE